MNNGKNPKEKELISEEEEPESTEEETEEEPNNSGSENRSSGNREMTDAEIKAFERRELSKKVPGFGNLFHVDPEFAHESARLNKQMIFGFAARDMQQAVLDLNSGRTLSAWDIFKLRFMGYTISEDGKGRDESIALHQLTAEEKQAASQGGLVD